MALDIIVTNENYNRDPLGRDLVEFLREEEANLGLSDAVLYYDFPAYADYEAELHAADLLLLSPEHGVVALGLIREGATTNGIRARDESLNQFASTLIGRFLRSRVLRKSLSQLAFPVAPILLGDGKIDLVGDQRESAVLNSLGSLADHLQGMRIPPLDAEVLAEARSVLEGAKALTRPQKRVIDDPQAQPLAAAISTLELEIHNFDQKQRRAALINVEGPERIRGLAGSGKTVILAMKAAYLHLKQPDQRILFTFYTRSLRASIKNLITRFYRHYRDEDPDWNFIHIRHGWGGKNTSGTYADASRRAGRTPLGLSEAKSIASTGQEPFDAVCREILANVAVEPYYDHVLIDEGQDFPSSFYELCFYLCKGERDRKNIVWAYDELQNILNVKIRTPEELFGNDQDGLPRISLARSQRYLPAGAANDIVLSKCYRNQGQVLVSAHALGFGIYGQIVQLLESPAHWEDVGYRVITPDFAVGNNIRIERPLENSPLSLANTSLPLIQRYAAPGMAEEVSWICSRVRSFLEGGLKAEDIVIIALDDRNARHYFREISQELAASGIGSNNIIADPYNEPPFSISGKVTLSTVYRAKGNESAAVIVVGIDAIPTRTRSGRNKVFTAFTRSKAWLCVSGIQPFADQFIRELDTAVLHYPELCFVMPDLDRINLIQRDLTEKAAAAKKAHEEYLLKLQELGFSEDDVTSLIPEAKGG